MRTLAKLALSVLVLSGCGAQATPAQLPKECSEVPVMIGGHLSKFSALAEKPKELEAEVAAAVTEAESKATAISDATIKQAVQDFADRLKAIEIGKGKKSIEATQTAIKTGTDTIEQVAKVCQ
ncbi:hypothetical protein [Acrocarpospora catenulata]|uniref:hypothetical protein n=1 Tax=Acrocarpospora catenulata TaxID=2836182 RepID=UPI001BDB46AA|nr:hypothetical protein [Acrocarpospora catenulata]